MKNYLSITAVILTITISVVGCGTIMQGTTQQVGISSNPSSARVSMNGESKGETPMVLDLKRKNTYLVKLELDGYEPYETTLTRKTSGWVWGNIVFGGLVGLVVDAAAGGMYKLTPEQVTAELRSRQMSVLETEDGVYIAFVLQPKAGWEKLGQMQPQLP